jgi:Sugar (and other) transporter
MYYSSTLFALVGFSNPTAVGLVVSGTNFIMTFINAAAVDPWGRRRVLVTTVWGMSAALLAVAVAFTRIPVNTETLALEQTTISTAAIVVLVFIVLFVMFYGVSVGNTAWMSTDFFSQEVRSMGTMWMTCSCWASNGQSSISTCLTTSCLRAFSHCLLHLPHANEVFDSIGNLWLLCGHLLHRLDTHHLLLPGGLRPHNRRDFSDLRLLDFQDGEPCEAATEAEEGRGNFGSARSRQDCYGSLGSVSRAPLEEANRRSDEVEHLCIYCASSHHLWIQAGFDLG